MSSFPLLPPPKHGEADYSATTFTPTRVLLLLVHNVKYDVKVDAIRQIFSKYPLEKILVFKSQDPTGVLVVLNSVEAAVQARGEYHNRQMYPGSNEISVYFSSTADFPIRFGDENGWENRPSYPPPTTALAHDQTPVAQSYITDPRSASGPPSTSPPYGQPYSAPASTQSQTFQYPGPYPSLAPSGHYPPTPYGQPSYPPFPAPGYPPYDRKRPFEGEHPPAQRQRTGEASHVARGEPRESHMECNCVVRVSQSYGITADELFNLCGLYGDVIKVKTPSNGPALVQFSRADEVGRALQNLIGCPWNGRKLGLTHVREMHSIVDGPDVTDFSSSPRHRWRCSTGKQQFHICKPNVNIFISNVDNKKASKEYLKEQFSKFGTVKEVVTIKTKGDSKVMAVVQMDTVEGSVKALANLESHKTGSLFLRMNFSDRELVIPRDQREAGGPSV